MKTLFDATEVFLEGPIPPELAGEFQERFRADHSVGAHLVFLGQVRADEIASGTVTGIEYSAHETMARTAFADLVERVTSGSDIAGLAIRHSLGYVPAGGASLLIAVATGHREQAYALSRELLEAIKREVPIYGREITNGDRSQWKVNR